MVSIVGVLAGQEGVFDCEGLQRHVVHDSGHSEGVPIVKESASYLVNFVELREHSYTLYYYRSF